MKSVSKIILIMNKELRSMFASPIFFIMAACFCFIMGWIFFNLLITYLESVHNHMVNQSNITFSDGVVKPFFSNMNFMLALMTPIFTMKTLANEKERGTLDLLLSSSLSPWELVIGKFLASWLSLISMIALSLTVPFILGISEISITEIALTGYLAIFLNVMIYNSLGILLSTLTANQNVAALTTLVSILFLWMIPWAAQTSHNLILINIYTYLGVMTHFTSILNGVLTSSDIFYYVSSSIVFVMLAVLFMYKRQKL